MSDSLKKAQFEAAQFQHGDGTLDLTFAAAFLLGAVCFWGVGLTGNLNSFFSTKVVPVLAVVAFLGGGVLIDALVKWFKMHITGPRSGIIPAKKGGLLNLATRRAIWISLPLLTLILLIGVFIFKGQIPLLHQDTRTVMLPMVWGLLFGGMWFLAGRKVGLRHFYLISVISLAVSTMLVVSKVDGESAMVILLGALGLALSVSGGITMWHYLSDTALSKPVSPDI
jgi:hypothetical protein